LVKYFIFEESNDTRSTQESESEFAVNPRHCQRTSWSRSKIHEAEP